MAGNGEKARGTGVNGAVLVTGGTGVVGRALVSGLVATGRRVILLSRGMQPIRVANGAEHLHGDVAKPALGLDQTAYTRLAEQITSIYHLAARTDFKSSDVEEYVPINIDGCHNVLALAHRAGAHLHHVSTAFVCGTHAGRFGEHQLECGQEFRNGYEQSKFLAERELRRLADQNGVPLTVYRPSIILERRPDGASPIGFGPFVFLDAVFRLLLSPAYRQHGSGTIRIAGSSISLLPFIFDDDVARALLAISASDACKGQTYHLVAKQPFANTALEDIFNRAFGRKVACWVDQREFDSRPPDKGERIIARKTAMYSPYLNLTVQFSRTNLDLAMGEDFCRSVTPDEVFRAFHYFLQAKKNSDDVVVHSTEQQTAVREYFTSFLPVIMGKNLIDNLVSLSCNFWITVEQLGHYSLVIDSGKLTDINTNRVGTFGYLIGAETFLQVVSGEMTPQQGFFNGSIEIEGKMLEALQTAVALEEFFRLKPFIVR